MFSLPLEPLPSYLLAEVSLEKEFREIKLQGASVRLGRLPDPPFFL